MDKRLLDLTKSAVTYPPKLRECMTEKCGLSEFVEKMNALSDRFLKLMQTKGDISEEIIKSELKSILIHAKQISLTNLDRDQHLEIMRSIMTHCMSEYLRQIKKVLNLDIKTIQETIKQLNAVKKRIPQRGGSESEEYEKCLVSKCNLQNTLANYNKALQETAMLQTKLKTIDKAKSPVDFIDTTIQLLESSIKTQKLAPEYQSRNLRKILTYCLPEYIDIHRQRSRKELDSYIARL